jgi:putative transposase
VSAFEFIAAEKANHPVSLMCRVLGVSRPAFHAWRRRGPSRRALEDARLTQLIREIHGRTRGVYGVRRMHAELRHAHGIRVGRKRVERLMRQAGISGLVTRRRRRTTIRVPGVRVAGDLVERDFKASVPDRLWVADITYLTCWEGTVYLAAVIDCFSRRVVGWSMGDHMRAELVVDALHMALARRRPGPGLVHHSDQGSQYVSLAFGQRCREAGIALSMGSKGDAYDNAVCEAFFSSIKKELIRRRSWPTRRELQTAVFDYIEMFFNRERRHSTLGYLSPHEYEKISISLEREERAA